MPRNTFYSDYDTESIEGNRPSDYRTAFQIDRDRILHSSAFRKLQSKTQVYLSGEYDFYRTRLTHSIEVAQVGRSICNALQSRGDFLRDDFHIDSDLVEACCLSHDLGHPPFGHTGERALHRLFLDHGGFEGNAQTLRLITDTLYHGSKGQVGMAPTRAFLDGVLKYKDLFSELECPDNHFIYDFQRPYRDFAHEASESLVGQGAKGAFAGLSSIECQIMDWADDTAYCLNDIVDGVKAGFLTVEKLEKWANKSSLDAVDAGLLEDFLLDVRRENIEAVFGRKIGGFITACSLESCENALSAASNRYRFALRVDQETKLQAKFYKRVSLDLIFKSAPLQQMDFKFGRVLEDLFSALRDSHLKGAGDGARILPDPIARLLSDAQGESARWIVVRDYLAGLSDGQALRIYRRLFDADYGSIVDLE